MSVVEVSSPAHECWVKEIEILASPLLKELLFETISPPEGAECLNYLDLNYSDGNQIQLSYWIMNSYPYLTLTCSDETGRKKRN